MAQRRELGDKKGVLIRMANWCCCIPLTHRMGVGKGEGSSSVAAPEFSFHKDSPRVDAGMAKTRWLWYGT
jgi:hypothetical protein